jgi:hypothetical protein
MALGSPKKKSETTEDTKKAQRTQRSELFLIRMQQTDFLSVFRKTTVKN